jgi:hypothetical protein
MSEKRQKKARLSSLLLPKKKGKALNILPI